MGDDVVNVVIPEVEEEHETLDETGMQLVQMWESCLNRCDNLVLELGALNARITSLEGELAIFRGQEFALAGHSHDEYSPVGHTHAEFALLEHSHEAENPERDVEPEKQHPWFRRIEL